MKQPKLGFRILYFLGTSPTGLVFYSVVFIIILSQRLLSSPTNLFSGVSISAFYGTWVYSLMHHINLFLALNSVGKTFLFALWLVVGLTIYLFVNSVNKSVKELATGLSEADGKYVIPKGVNKNRALLGFIEGFVIRLVTIVVLFFYLRFVLNLYSVWLKKPNVFEYLNARSIIDGFTLLVVVFCLLHILTLIIRLVLLRIRIFNK